MYFLQKTGAVRYLLRFIRSGSYLCALEINAANVLFAKKKKAICEPDHR